MFVCLFIVCLFVSVSGSHCLSVGRSVFSYVHIVHLYICVSFRLSVTVFVYI